MHAMAFEPSTEAPGMKVTKKTQLKGSFLKKPLPDSPPRTPTALETAAHDLLCEIETIHHGLHGCASLAPGASVDGLLIRLVALSIKPYSAEFVKHLMERTNLGHLATLLRPICAEAEGELEMHWGKKLLEEMARSKGKSARDLLETFPYYANYIDLSRLECSLISAYLPSNITSSRKPLNCAFLGSGPLPMSSWCLLDAMPAARMHNIDRDQGAIAVSRTLSEKLGYGSRMHFVQENLSADRAVDPQIIDWTQFDVVFLAALVGMHSDAKSAILSELVQRLRPGCLLVCRSVRGLRNLLYPMLDLSDWINEAGLEVLIEAHPWTSVVNSVVILTVKSH